MTHNSSDDAGAPCHSYIHQRRVMQEACFTLFVRGTSLAEVRHE